MKFPLLITAAAAAATTTQLAKQGVALPKSNALNPPPESSRSNLPPANKGRGTFEARMCKKRLASIETQPYCPEEPLLEAGEERSNSASEQSASDTKNSSASDEQMLVSPKICPPDLSLARTHPIPNDLPVNMLASYKAVKGSENRDALSIMNAVLVNGEIDADAFEKVMTEVTPKALFDAMNQASWCGSRSSELADSMKMCLETIREKNVHYGDAFPHTRPPTDEEAAQVNVVRLAFARIFGPYVGVLDNKAVKPIEMTSTLRGFSAGWAAHAEHPEHVYKHVFVKEGDSASRTMATLMHELLHAKTHRAVRAILQGFIEEAVTEFLATHDFSKDTHDSIYEKKMGSDALARRFVDAMGKSGTKLSAGSFEAGMEFLRLAYLSADTEATQKLAAVVEPAVEEWKSEMQQKFQMQNKPYSNKVSNVMAAIYLTAFIALIGHRIINADQNNRPIRNLEGVD
jgi:hypothetical protein